MSNFNKLKPINPCKIKRVKPKKINADNKLNLKTINTYDVDSFKNDDFNSHNEDIDLLKVNDSSVNSNNTDDVSFNSTSDSIFTAIMDLIVDTSSLTFKLFFSKYEGYDVSAMGYTSLDVTAGFEFTQENTNKKFYAINFKDGKQVWFDPNTKKPVIIIDQEHSINISFDYDISEEEREEISKLYFRDKKLGDVPIDYIININIRGHNIKFTSINNGDNTSAMVLANRLSVVFSKLYTDEMLELLEKYYKGSLISSWENATTERSETGLGYNTSAYKSGNKEVGYFTFFPTEVLLSSYYSAYYGLMTPIHEMGHVFESIFVNEGKMDQNNWNLLYEKYKAIIVDISGGSGYTRINGYNESPNEKEFFAESTLIYYTFPEELKRYMPEVYNILNDLYKHYN